MEITPETYWYVRKFLAHKVAFEDAVKGKASLELSHLTSAGGSTISEIAEKTSVEEVKLYEFNKWLKGKRIPTDKEYAVVIPSGDFGEGFGVLAIAPINAMTINEVIDMPSAEEGLEINGVRVIRAEKGEGIAALARRGNVSMSAFLHYNEMTIDKPVHQGQLFFVHNKRKRAMEDLYTMKPGEDVWSVSQKFGVQQKFIFKFNVLNDDSKPETGTTLYLTNHKPASGEMVDNTAVVILNKDDSFDWEQPTARNDGSHEVLWSPVASANQKNVMPEQELNASLLKEPSGVVSPLGSTHEVKSTDTLYSVARQYGVTIKELMQWNDKKDFSLTVGEKLKVSSR